MHNKLPKVDLVHPTGNQVVRHLLVLLEKAGLLQTFYTTLAFKSSSAWTRLLPSSFRTECERRTYALPEEKQRARPSREIFRLIAQRLRIKFLTRHETGWASVDRIYQDLDRSVARRLRKSYQSQQPACIYGYEDGCLETFRAARQLGIKCFYDLPIAHWQTLRRLLKEEALRLPEWEPTLVGTRDSNAKLDRKAEELDLADCIISPSLFVHRSLPEKVRQTKPCFVAEFGSPQAADIEHPAERTSKKLRVLFAGSMTQRKGLADVFAAMPLLKRSDVELVVMGSLISPMEFYRKIYKDFIYEPTRPNQEVLKLMRSCDLLLLPSLVEGRALVQHEALAQGLPLIVTENAGGEDLIVPGETGFLVPIRSPERIAEKISWFADHRNDLPQIRQATKRKAAEYSWERYADRVIEALKTPFSNQEHLKNRGKAPGK